MYGRCFTQNMTYVINLRLSDFPQFRGHHISFLVDIGQFIREPVFAKCITRAVVKLGLNPKAFLRRKTSLCWNLKEKLVSLSERAAELGVVSLSCFRRREPM